MAIALVNKTVGNSLSPTIPATGAGNCLVVCVASTFFAAASSISGITLGGAADNFAQLVAPETTTTGGNAAALMWADPNCAGGQTAVVISGSNLFVGNGSGGVTVYEVSGLAATIGALLDQSSAGVTNGTTWSSGATPVTGRAAEFWAGVVSSSSGTSTGPGAPWTNDLYTGNGGMSGYQVTSAAGAATFSGTQTAGAGAALVATLQPGTPPVPSALPLNLDTTGVCQDQAQFQGPPLGSGYIR